MRQPEASAPSLANANPASLEYADPGTTAYAHPAVSIVSPHFCSPQPVDIAIVRKGLIITDGKYEVSDVNGNVIFKVKRDDLSLLARMILLDTAGYPIISLRKKFLSAHERWQVFRGDSTETRDLIFSATRSSMFQFKTKLDIFLANNIAEKAPDFKIKGSWFERSCVIYGGNSSTIVAQMHKKRTVESVLFGEDKFMVTVYPGIDSAFIIALIVIFDKINIK